MDVTKRLSIVIPIRIDSVERKENLDSILSYLLDVSMASVIILEADEERRYFYHRDTDRVKHIFIEDKDPIFHRTYYLNVLIRMAETNIVGVWDTDVFLRKSQIDMAIYEILNGITLCYPYDGRFAFLNEEESKYSRRNILSFIQQIKSKKQYSLMRHPSVGGAFIVNKERYLLVGGENENFYGWSPEDVERNKRLEILGEPISRVSGILYHLYHPRGINSMIENDVQYRNNMKELLNICSLDRKHLELYVRNMNKVKKDCP